MKSRMFNVTNLPKTTTLFESMTDTVNVLPHLIELKEAWRVQNFRFTKDQKEQYEMLLQARRERVKYFYENDLVQKGPKVVKEKEQEDQGN